MLKVIGFDSRVFNREVIKKDGNKGFFKSVIGFGIRVDNYEVFDNKYKEVLKKIMDECGLEKEYLYYCTNDFKNCPKIDEVIEKFILEMEPYISKVHVFYTLFSPKRQKEIKVYGRYSSRNKIKLGKPTRNYIEFIDEHLINIFPEICAWRLTSCLSPPIQFHLDNFSGHIDEAYEELTKSNIQKLVFPSGDCTNPVISIADLFLHFFDKRMNDKKLFLIFDSIREAIPEYGEKVLTYPILNKHLPKITPLDKESINLIDYYKRPFYWVFKGNVQIDSRTLKRSDSYRKLLDCVASKGGTVILFSRNKDAINIKEGDFGVYLNDSGKETVLSYKKLGKKIIPFNMDLLIPDKNRKL